MSTQVIAVDDDFSQPLLKALTTPSTESEGIRDDVSAVVKKDLEPRGPLLAQAARVWLRMAPRVWAEVASGGDVAASAYRLSLAQACLQLSADKHLGVGGFEQVWALLSDVLTLPAREAALAAHQMVISVQAKRFPRTSEQLIQDCASIGAPT